MEGIILPQIDMQKPETTMWLYLARGPLRKFVVEQSLSYI